MRAGTFLMSFLWILKLVGGEPTEVKSPRRFDDGGIPLRWDNVEGAPLWLDGSPPEFSFSEGLHVIVLEPGGSTRIRLPPVTALRIVASAQPLLSEDLEAWVSDGSGLALRSEMKTTSDPRSLIVYPSSTKTNIVELIHPSSRTTPLEIRLFVSRMDFPSRRDAFGGLVVPEESPSRVSESPFSLGERYWRGGKRSSVRVQGPARLALLTRLVFPPEEGKSHQSYEVRVEVGGRRLEFQLETAREQGSLWLDFEARWLGVERTAYFAVPDGEHELTIEATAAVLWRLLQGSPRDYLLEDEPLHLPEPAFFLSLSPETGGESPGIPGHSLVPEVQALLKGLKENRTTDAGLLAALHCRRIATSLATHPDDRAAALSIIARHTYWRNLLPGEKRVTDPQVVAAFVPRRLLEPWERAKDITLTREELPEVLGNWSSGFFLRAPEGEEKAHIYRIPKRYSPSLLRVVVETRSASLPSELMVDLGRGGSAHLRTVGVSEVPLRQFQPARAEAALAALRARDPLSLPATSLATVPAGMVELPLPQDVEEVRLWALGPEPPPLVALQYAAEKPYELTEMEYLDAAESGASQLLQDLRAWERGEDLEEAAGLRAHRTPLFRLWSDARRRYAASLADEAPSVAQEDPAQLVAAERFERTGEWVQALEAWGKLAESGSPETSRVAKMRKTAVLQRLGERFLAEMQLRGFSLQRTDSRLRREAFERLSADYAISGEDEALLGLLFAVAAESGEPEHLRRLSELLAARGEHLMAVDVGRSLPEAEQPVDTLLHSASMLGWWRTFDGMLARLPGAEERDYWRGVREALTGNAEGALVFLERAGARGAPLTDRLRQAFAIRRALGSPDPVTRCRAILSWESWQASDPGPWTWSEDSTLIVDHAGGDSCFSLARNLAEHYWRGSPGRPVRANVLGPVTLRLEARPIHSEDFQRPLNSWILVRVAGLLFPVAVTNNTPASGLTLVNSRGKQPGVKVTTELDLGPGLHSIEISSPSEDILVRLLVRESTRPLGVLPRLTQRTLAAVMNGRRPEDSAEAYGARLFQKGEEGSVPIQPPSDDLTPQCVETPVQLDPPFAARMALRMESLSEGATGLRASVNEEEALPPRERFLAAARLGMREAMAELAVSLEDQLPPGWAEGVFLSSGEFQRAVDVSEARRARQSARGVDLGEQAALQAMSLHLYIAEMDAPLRRKCQVGGQALFSKHSGLPGIQGPYQRLVRSLDWRKIVAIADSAGSRYVDVSGWQPENSDLKVRKALLGSFGEDEWLLVGDNRIEIALENLKPTVLRLELTLQTLQFAYSTALTVSCQVDGGDPWQVPLSPESPSTLLEAPVAEGNHTVRLRVERPLMNHFVRVRIKELRDAQILPSSSGDAENLWKARRLYHIATQERPLIASVEGPAWVRIDELREGRTISRYEAVPEGWQELVLTPEPGQTEALFRLFEKVEVPEASPLVAYRPPESILSVPPPALGLSPDPSGENIAIEDLFSLGGQEDGTFSVRLSLERQKAFEEDFEAGTTFDNFLELRGTHRYFHERLPAYFETSLLVRGHDDAGPSLGFEEDLHFRPRWLPLNFRLTGTAYCQWPDGGTVMPEGPLEWALALRGSLSRRYPLGLHAYHEPSVALLGRILSLEKGEHHYDAVLDQDVFTLYKADHPSSLTLSETIGYKPWLDVEWWGRASLTSNEELNPIEPDHLSGWLGWKQFHRPLELDAGYRVARFFGDADRDRPFTRHGPFLELLCEIWCSPRSRLELGLSYRHDFPENEDTGFVCLTWHFSNGRNYRDFWPGDVDFLDLREPRDWNDSIREVQHE